MGLWPPRRIRVWWGVWACLGWVGWYFLFFIWVPVEKGLDGCWDEIWGKIEGEELGGMGIFMKKPLVVRKGKRKKAAMMILQSVYGYSYHHQDINLLTPLLSQTYRSQSPSSPAATAKSWAICYRKPPPFIFLPYIHHLREIKRERKANITLFRT